MEDKAQRDYFVSQIPSGRAGSAEEIGAVAGLLADNESSYVTGAAYVVDGGFTI